MSVSGSRLLRRIIYLLVLIVIVGFVWTRFFGVKKSSNYMTATVVKGEVMQTVALTGTVQPGVRYQLQFSKPGKLERVCVKVGDKVKAGDVLAVLEHQDAEYQLAAQKAALRMVQANLAKAYIGPRDEDVTMNQLKIQLAQISSEAAIKSKDNAALVAKQNISFAEAGVQNAFRNLVKAQDSLMTAQKSGNSQALQDAMNALDKAQSAQQQAQQTYDQAVMTSQTQADNLDTTADSSDINQQLAQAQFDLLQAQPRDTDIAPLQAQVDQAWQSVHLYEHQLELATLKAPGDGIVTDIAADVGENVGSGAQSFLTLDSSYNYIKVLVSEADIVKIQKGQEVDLSFDAFSLDHDLKGKVEEIAPAETVVQGVVYYEVRVDFSLKDSPVKAGMTANLMIKTEDKTDVLIVPTRAIQYDGDQAYVQILKSGHKEELEHRNVTIGLQGDENNEIISGLQEGEEVVTFTKPS